MLNSLDLDSDPEDYLLQEDDDLDEPDEKDEDLHRNLDSDIRKIKRAAFESCINDIEVDDEYPSVKNIWTQAQGIVRKPWFREVAIISAILILRTGLFWAYRQALRNNLEIGTL